MVDCGVIVVQLRHDCAVVTLHDCGATHDGTTREQLFHDSVIGMLRVCTIVPRLIKSATLARLFRDYSATIVRLRSDFGMNVTRQCYRHGTTVVSEYGGLRL